MNFCALNILTHYAFLLNNSMINCTFDMEILIALVLMAFYSISIADFTICTKANFSF